MMYSFLHFLLYSIKEKLSFSCLFSFSLSLSQTHTQFTNSWLLSSWFYNWICHQQWPSFFPCCSDCPGFLNVSLSRWLLGPLNVTPRVFEHLLLFCHKSSQGHLVPSSPQNWDQLFLQRAWVPLWEIPRRNQNPGTWCARGCWACSVNKAGRYVLKILICS
jgi:hypothetical protein